jgi:hypothetical protein
VEINWEGDVRRRRAGFLLIFGAMVPLAIAATAWACGNLATLRIEGPTTVNPGSTVTVLGSNYRASPPNTPVQIRLDSRTGPVLREVVPDADNKINTQVTIPANTAPDWHMLVGTQYSIATGVPASGTPGRTVLRVQGAAVGASSPWSSAPGGAPVRVDGGGPGGPAPLPTLLAAALSLALLGTGLTLVARSRTRTA